MTGLAKQGISGGALVACALSCALSWASVATAQEPVMPAVVYERTPLQVVEEPPPLVRPRIGFSALGGYTFDEPEGWMLGASIRVGMTVGEWFSVYYQPTGLYAALDRPGSGEDGAFALWNTLLLELSPIPFLSIGIGPSADIWVDCDAGVATNVEQVERVSGEVGCADSSVSFGAHGRVALNLGGGRPGAGGGVQISFEAHPTWFGGDYTTVALLGGLGFEIF